MGGNSTHKELEGRLLTTLCALRWIGFVLGMGVIPTRKELEGRHHTTLRAIRRVGFVLEMGGNSHP